jgi:hypothetical protein
MTIHQVLLLNVLNLGINSSVLFWILSLFIGAIWLDTLLKSGRTRNI